jgi:YHS domain-containing protein
MARFILFIVLAAILYYVLHFLIKDMPSLRRKMDRGSEAEELVQDPYCQTYIPKESAVRKKINGRMLHFCNQECLRNYLEKIKKNKEK